MKKYMKKTRAYLFSMSLCLYAFLSQTCFAEDIFAGALKQEIDDNIGQHSEIMYAIMVGGAVLSIYMYLKTKNILAGISPFVICIVFIKLVFPLIASTVG